MDSLTRWLRRSKRCNLALGVAGVLLCALLLLMGRASIGFPVPPVYAAPGDELTCVGVTYVPQSECEALVDLYNATGGSLWTVNDSWLTSQADTPCNWLGVQCDLESGHVVGLALRNKGLSGLLPEMVFARLPNLVDLDLGRNDLVGPIPAEIAALAYLKRLYLDNNGFSGSIPAGLMGDETPPPSYAGTRPQLNLGDNDLTGTLPVDLGVDLSIVTVASLSVHNNLLLHGPIPTAYAERIDLFRWTQTDICVPRDLAVSTWLNIPQDSWDSDERMCPQANGILLDPAPGTRINGEVVSDTVIVEQDTLITCGVGQGSCAEVRARCHLGEWVIAEIIASDFLIGFKEFTFDDDTFDSSSIDVDPITSVIMMVADPSPEIIEAICGDTPPADVMASARQVEIGLTLTMMQGGIQLQASSPTTTLQISTPHAVIESVGAATLEVAVPSDEATLLSVVAGAATMSPIGASGGPGALPPLGSDTGRLITADGIAVGFVWGRSLFVPVVRAGSGG